MLSWRKKARENILLRIVLVAILGILCSDGLLYKLNFGSIIPYLITLELAIILWFIIFYHNSSHSTYSKARAILTYILIFITFILLHFTGQEIFKPKYQKALKEPIIGIHINGDLVLRGNTWNGNAALYVKDKIIAKIKVQIDSNLHPNYEDYFILHNQIENINNKRHPGDFDYKEYLKNKHVFHTIRIKDQNLLKRHKKNVHKLLKYSHDSRNKLIDRLSQGIKDTSSFELAAALLLGYRAELDKDLMKIFSETGTIHIISVSGLHVGIIFIVLQWIISKMKFLKNRFLNACILVSCIWFYALLTGLPASVSRCALMISIGILSKIIYRKTSAYNILSGSALILLSLDTNLIFDVGFQLSYLAVLGILLFQKGIEHMIWIPNKYLHQLWALSSVSIAAQLSTLPLCLYYYHQFPNYFILANLFAIPLSSIALYASILVLIFADVPIIGMGIFYVLKYSLEAMNWMLEKISKFPYAISESLYIDISLSIGLACVIAIAYVSFQYKERTSIKYFITVLIIMHILFIYRHNKITEQVYFIPSRQQGIVCIQYNKNLTHYISKDIDKNSISSYLDKWENLGRYNHRVILYNKNKNIRIMGENTEIILDYYPHESSMYKKSYSINQYLLSGNRLKIDTIEIPINKMGYYTIM